MTLQTAATRSPDEVLEALWTLEERGSADLREFRREAAACVDDQLIASMRQEGLVDIADGAIRLLPPGRERAKQIIRRHRLAERLLCDVLGIPVEDSEDAACEFEHVLAEGITSSICTLLGHPRYCPHNRRIPEGECCRQARSELEPIVASCTSLRPGQEARIAYLCTRDHPMIHKLAAIGILPGARIRLLQKWPSYVLQSEETEIAIEEDLASQVYVWLKDPRP